MDVRKMSRIDLPVLDVAVEMRFVVSLYSLDLWLQFGRAVLQLGRPARIERRMPHAKALRRERIESLRMFHASPQIPHALRMAQAERHRQLPQRQFRSGCDRPRKRSE